MKEYTIGPASQPCEWAIYLFVLEIPRDDDISRYSQREVTITIIIIRLMTPAIRNYGYADGVGPQTTCVGCGAWGHRDLVGMIEEQGLNS